MTISKKDLQEAYSTGKGLGIHLGKQQAEQDFNTPKAAAQRDILKAAAELAQANAKLTYSLSRMITEKGW